MSTTNRRIPTDFQQLEVVHDLHSGLQAVIAIHNTKLGPALGGCRMWSYASEEDAIHDAVRLAQGMTYKSAMSGLPFGGGKAVIIGNPAKHKNERLFRSLGRFIRQLRGRYITGMDVGTTPRDMDWIREETRYVTDTTGSLGAIGDFTADMTAYGVYLGIKASARKVYGSETLSKRTIAVQGLGKVGFALCRYLARSGAQLVVSDLNEELTNRVEQQFGARTVHVDAIHTEQCDIFSPCALGGILNDESIPLLNCRIVAGAANNQLAEAKHGTMLHKRDIVFAPDYVINAGGIIVTSAELNGNSPSFARGRVERIYSTLTEVYARSTADGLPTAAAADLITEQLLANP